MQGVLILVTVLADLRRRRRQAIREAATTAAKARARAPSWLGQEAVAAILILALLVLAFTSEQFLTVDNLLNQGRLPGEVGLVALPMTMIIVTGGIDLSAGSILGLCAIMLGVLWKNLGLPLELAIALTLVIGTQPGWSTAGSSPASASAADRHAGDARPLSRPGRGHQPGALGARLPRLVLRPGPAPRAGRPTQLWLLGVAILVFGVALARTSFGRTSTPSATTRPPRASPACRSTAPSSPSTVFPPWRHSPPGSSSAGSRPPARTWAPASSST